MRNGKTLCNSFGQTVEKFMIGQPWRELAFLAVKKNQIDVGTVIEFVAAEFSKRQDGKLCIGRTEFSPQFVVPMAEHLTKRNLCDVRKLGRRFLQRRDISN